MKQRWFLAVVLSGLFLWIAAPVAAGPGTQGGGIHFGPYTLASGDSASGDLTVFGPATLEANTQFDGDLTVMGAAIIQNGARVDGNLVVFGAADIAGEVDGDVFTAGAVTLQETADVSGDVSALGPISQQEGAEVEGEVTPMEEEDFEWDFPVQEPPIVTPEIHIERQPGWVRGLWGIVRNMINVLVMGLLALVVASIWPRPLERVSRVIEETPLTAFGMGLLMLLMVPLIFVLLAVTICLLPLGIVGLIIVGVGMVLGWIALGSIVGRRVLGGLLNQAQPNLVAAAVLGTTLTLLVVALTKIIWPVYGLLMFALTPLAAGAVLLTRFGTMPYATQGRAFTPVAPHPYPRPAPMPAAKETTPSSNIPSTMPPGQNEVDRLPPSE